jgi:hypothetical protein
MTAETGGSSTRLGDEDEGGLRGGARPIRGAVAQDEHRTDLLPAQTAIPSDRQRAFLRYFTGTLIDLVVLGLFAEFSTRVYVDTFSMALLAAILLQILLKLTIAVEHHVAGYFKGATGGFMKFLRYFCAWLVLFGSKFVILEALAMTFGESVRFEGVLHGLVALIIVVVTMLIVEEIVVRIYRKLA